MEQELNQRRASRSITLVLIGTTLMAAACDDNSGAPPPGPLNAAQLEYATQPANSPATRLGGPGLGSSGTSPIVIRRSSSAAAQAMRGILDYLFGGSSSSSSYSFSNSSGSSSFSHGSSSSTIHGGFGSSASSHSSMGG